MMQCIYDFFFAKRHSFAYVLVMIIQAAVTASTGMVLLPFLLAVAACFFIFALEEVHEDMEKIVGKYK